MRDYMFVFQSDKFVALGYTDSDFQLDKDSDQSTSSLIFTFGVATIS